MNAYSFYIGGETEIIAADTVIEMLLFYRELTGIGLDDLDKGDNVFIIPEIEWDNYTIKNEDGATETLRQLMNGLAEPTFISSTAF